MAFTPNEAGIAEMGRRLAAVLQKVISDVARDKAGHPAAEVEAEIVRRAKAAGLNYTPGADLHKIAEAIERGSYDEAES